MCIYMSIVIPLFPYSHLKITVINCSISIPIVPTHEVSVKDNGASSRFEGLSQQGQTRLSRGNRNRLVLLYVRCV